VENLSEHENPVVRILVDGLAALTLMVFAFIIEISKKRLFEDHTPPILAVTLNIMEMTIPCPLD
jgi:hypothetical protein